MCCQNSRIKDARSLAAVVSEENDVLSNAVRGVVVRSALPVATGNRLGLALGARLGAALGLGRSLRSRGRLGGGGSDGLTHRSNSGGLVGGLSGDSVDGSDSSGRAEVVVLPRDDLAVNSGSDPLGTLLLALLVEVLVAMATGVDVRRGSDITLLLLRGKVVDSKLLEVDGATDVEGELR